MERLRVQHYVAYEIWKGNYSSPMEWRLKNGNTKVLDIGSGPGTWITHMASTYQSSAFVGVDFSPIYPKPSFNSIFLRHNILECIPFPDSSFDFVYQRFLEMSFDEVGWNNLFAEIVRVMKPDGWLEMMNFEWELINPGPNMKKLADAVVKFHESENIKIPTKVDLKNYFERTQKFTDIKIEERCIPIGRWAGRIGQFAKSNFNYGIMGLKPFLLPFMNITSEQFQSLLDNSEDEVEISEEGSIGEIHATVVKGEEASKEAGWCIGIPM
ncbi:15337_t:CDS:2, partial [Acaulospora colombiana]